MTTPCFKTIAAENKIFKCRLEYYHEGECEPGERSYIEPKYIIVERAEGPTASCGKPVVVKTFEDSDKVLKQWADTAPTGGGYDKVDFSVIYRDGELYQGRFDMVQEDQSRVDLLGEHMRSFSEWHSGNTLHPHCGDEVYKGLVEGYKKDGIAEYCQNLLDKYRIGRKYEPQTTTP